jgi:hypothetical protein
VRRHEDVDRRIADAFRLRAPGCGEILPVELPEPGRADVVVLRDPTFDALLTGESHFDELPT